MLSILSVLLTALYYLIICVIYDSYLPMVNQASINSVTQAAVTQQAVMIPAFKAYCFVAATL